MQIFLIININVESHRVILMVPSSRSLEDSQLIEEALSPVDIESEFEECMRSCYPETTQVAWASFDTISILKAMDPIAWELAQSEWTSNEEADGQLISFDNGSTYFQRNEIENYLQKESD